MSLIDFGCGGGFDAKEFKKITGGEVVGVDIQQSMIDFAEKDNNGVSFILGDMRKTDYPDDYFDCTISNCSLCHLEDKPEAIREMMRVLKNGGQFVISDLTNSDGSNGVYYISLTEYLNIFNEFPFIKSEIVSISGGVDDSYRVITFYGIK